MRWSLLVLASGIGLMPAAAQGGDALLLMGNVVRVEGDVVRVSRSAIAILEPGLRVRADAITINTVAKKVVVCEGKTTVETDAGTIVGSNLKLQLKPIAEVYFLNPNGMRLIDSSAEGGVSVGSRPFLAPFSLAA